MTDIVDARGNNLSEKVGDTINQVVNQFSEGINAMFAGFKTMSHQGIQGFSNNGGNAQVAGNFGESTSEVFKDRQHKQMLRDKAITDSKIEFGAEDVRASGGN